MQITRKRPTRISSPPTAIALWEEYQRTGDTSARERLVFTFSPMVSHIVEHHLAQLRARHDVEDLVSCGLLALSDAVESYEPHDGVTLEQFAWTRIRDALREKLRRDAA